MEEKEELHNADLDEIIDFFPSVLKNIKDEIKNGITWENLIIIPGIKDQIDLTEKGINEDLNNYKEEVLKIQNNKDEIIIKRKKELNANEKKFVDKSKELIEIFKKIFKKFCKELNEGKLPNIKLPDDAVSYVGLKKLKDDLLEIEIYEKEQLNIFIKNFKEEIRKINDIIQDITNKLKEKLELKKMRLKEKIDQIIKDIKVQIEIYESIENPDNEKKDENMEKLIYIFNIGDFNSDKDKVTEVLDERISKLKDSLDYKRNIRAENFFVNIIDNEYYRNKKRFDDISQIYSMYYNQITEEIYNLQISGKSGLI